MNSKLTSGISLLIENLPVAIAAGLIAALLGAGLLGGQTAGAGAPATPFWPALAVGGALIIIGAIVIASPLIALFARGRAVPARPTAAPADNEEDETRH
jgi:hypothetical protein